MRRRDLILGLGGVLALPEAARAQQKRMPVVAILADTGVVAYASFLQGLREAGFVEGGNVAIDERYLHGQHDLMPAMAADLVRRKVAVIAAFSPAAAHAAKRATARIPIVFISWDPVLEGLVASLARPGGNLTGVSMIEAELTPKRLELLSELVPRAKLFGLLVNPDSPTASAVIGNGERAARTKGVELLVLKARTHGEIYAAFDALGRLHAGGLIVEFDVFFNSEGGTLAALTSVGGVPAVYGWSGIVQAGGLISYGASSAAAHRLMGIYTGKILKGAKPADLPVVQPDRFELIINLKAAGDLGLHVPQSLLALADRVIE
jgi:ABC-type uncharacterized transport system substrate-binding protein